MIYSAKIILDQDRSTVSRSSSLGVNGHAGSVQAEIQQKLSHYDSTLLYSTQLETEKQDKQKNGNSKEMPKQVLLLQKNPARPEVMRLANGNDFLPTASIMGQFLHPSPSQGDYRFSMRILNKHTEPPFCHLRRWILPCDSHLPPILSAQFLSAPTCLIYQQTMHPSANLPKTILIYPYPMYCHLPS